MYGFALGIEDTYSRPMERRCWPMRRTISWSRSASGGGGGKSPLRAASPFRWCACGAPFAEAGGRCMAGGGDSLRDRLRGAAPSSLDSLEARLGADCARRRRRARAAEITASAPTLQPRDVTATECYQQPRSQCTITLCSNTQTTTLFLLALLTPERLILSAGETSLNPSFLMRFW